MSGRVSGGLPCCLSFWMSRFRRGFVSLFVVSLSESVWRWSRCAFGGFVPLFVAPRRWFLLAMLNMRRFRMIKLLACLWCWHDRRQTNTKPEGEPNKTTGHETTAKQRMPNATKPQQTPDLGHKGPLGAQDLWRRGAGQVYSYETTENPPHGISWRRQKCFSQIPLKSSFHFPGRQIAPWGKISGGFVSGRSSPYGIGGGGDSVGPRPKKFPT